jgi:6-phosphogluconolactonase (cycloisomerase 2 family)
VSEAVFLVGSYTRLPTPTPVSEGIHRLSIDTATGALRLEAAIRHDRNPSWLGLDLRRGILWAADELGVADGGGLAPAARSPLPASGPLACRGPRDFAFAPGGLVLVASQRDHAIASFRLDPASGALAATGHATDCPSPVCLLPLD